PRRVSRRDGLCDRRVEEHECLIVVAERVAVVGVSEHDHSQLLPRRDLDLGAMAGRLPAWPMRTWSSTRRIQNPSAQPLRQSGRSHCTRCISRSVDPCSTCAPPPGPSRNWRETNLARSSTFDARLAGGAAAPVFTHGSWAL